MQKNRDKTKATLIALLLMFAMAVSLVDLPTANATKATFAYINATPNPIGVNQETLLHIGITEGTQVATDQWKGLTVTVTKPDGTTQTLGPYNTDSTGGTGDIFVPTMEGNYTLQTHFPAQWYNSTFIDRGSVRTISEYYEASDSEVLTLVVQAEPVEIYPGHALPTEYWTRPIDAQLREWYTIAGSWLYTPDNSLAVGNDDAPETAHILWTQPFTSGGLVGGEVGLEWSSNQGAVGFGIGDAYEGKWPGSRLILAGKLYWTEEGAGGGGGVAGSIGAVVYHCVDLRTSEELWAKTFLDNRFIAFGQLLYWQSMNYQGTFAYLWVTVGTTWYAFDAYSGNLRFTITDVPSGTTLRDDNGWIYILRTDLKNGWMAMWNMSALCTWSTSAWNSASWGNSVNGITFNASATYPNGTSTAAVASAWKNWTIPTDLPGSVGATFFGDRVIGASVSTSAVSLWGLSLEEGDEGDVLFEETWSAPAIWAAGNVTVSGFGGGFSAWSAEDKVAVMWVKELRKLYGFSLETGKYLWETEAENYLNIYSKDTKIAYGKVFSTGCSGIMYCYDAQTGDLLWTYEAYDRYTEILWANNWWMRTEFITDGKLYMGHEEHSPNQPLPRGAPFICLNATTGEEIWRIDGAFRQTHWGGRAIIGDSIIATQDTYDQSVYAIGKGPSATTVSAGPKSSVEGTSVVVEGMVTDISPGTEKYALTARFPNGVPAVCDANMSDWMLYVYKQFEKPADTVGVEVIISVLDPNNNYKEVARTTSDSNGFYSATFIPEVPGKYTVIAAFEGSGAYYGSSAETAINVEEAPQPTPTATPVPQEPVGTYFTISTVLIIAAIAIAVVLMLRKR